MRANTPPYRRVKRRLSSCSQYQSVDSSVRLRKRSSLSRSASSAARRADEQNSYGVVSTISDITARRRKAVFTDSQVTGRPSRAMPTT